VKSVIVSSIYTDFVPWVGERKGVLSLYLHSFIGSEKISLKKIQYGIDFIYFGLERHDYV
jgi:hypothetical protein